LLDAHASSTENLTSLFVVPVRSVLISVSGCSLKPFSITYIHRDTCYGVAGMRLEMQSVLCSTVKWVGWTFWRMTLTSSTVPTIQAGHP